MKLPECTCPHGDRLELLHDTTCPARHVHAPGDQRVFVFGSNLMGIHGAGAARYALERCGAGWGLGRGKFGRSYALPTCRVPGDPLTLDQLRRETDAFLAHAESNPDERYFVSRVGCGLAGFPEETVAELFRLAPSNCDLPPGWRS